jgi:hypothetical protein
VTISGDSGYEPDENFYINLSNPTNASISDNQGIGTITNDDTAPTVTLSVDDASIAEDEIATITATLSAASVSDVTVTLAIRHGDGRSDGLHGFLCNDHDCGRNPLGISDHYCRE